MRVGIVGCGGMGGVHANKYAQMQGVQMSVYDVDDTRATAFCDQRGAKKCGSLKQLLGSVQAVDVCLPTTAHVEAAVASLEAGLPTLVEKPMARTPDECERMIAAAEASGALLVPAHVVRFFPEYRAAHDLIRSGEIGTPASVRMRRGGGPPKADWFLDIDQSGGILLDLAVHEFDWLLWTFGQAKLVTSRSVRVGKTVKGADFKGDYALTTVSFASGCVAHVESTWMDPGGFRVTLEASGSDGSIEYDSRENPTLRTTTGSVALENNYAPADDPYFRQLSAFLEAAQGRQAPAVTGREGLAAVRLACAAIESSKTGEPVSLG